MKRILLPLAAALAVLLPACDKGNGRELSEYPQATTGDSLLYYFMQMQAQDYWDKTVSDTILRSPEQREKFLEGVEKGISLIGNNEAYNRGVRLGVRLAINLLDFEKKYDVDLNDGIMIESLRKGLSDEDHQLPLEDQQEFYRLLNKMKDQLKEKDRELARAALVKIAKDRGLQKVSDNLYYKTMRTGSGPMVADGDVIEVSADYQRADGDNLGLPSPITVTVGQSSLPQVMNDAYRRLNHGAVAQFATTAYQLFGSRTQIMGLNDSDVVIISMILNNIVQPTDDNHPGSSVVPRQ